MITLFNRTFRKSGISFHSAAAVLVLTPAAALAEPQTLQGQAIRAAVAGSTVEIDTPLGTKVPVKYGADNSVSGEAGSVAFFLGSAADTGRWWVAGEQLCHRWNVWFKAEKTCLKLTRDGSKITWLRDDGETGTATIMPKPEVVAARELSNKRSALGGPSGRIGDRITPASEAAVPAVDSLTVAEQADAPPADTQIQIAAIPAPAPEAPAIDVPALLPAAAKVAGHAPVAIAPAEAAAKPGAPAAGRTAAKNTATKRGNGTATFYVFGVAQNDVLNIRFGPSAETEVAGAIPPEGRGVRMTGGCEGLWCPVEFKGLRGWVNRSYLAFEIPELAAR